MLRDGKKPLSVHLSAEELNALLQNNNVQLTDSLGKLLVDKLKGVNFHSSNGTTNGENGEEEKEIKSNSLDKIADIMSTVIKKESNFDNKIGNIKKTKRDVSKEIDMLKDLD